MFSERKTAKKTKMGLDDRRQTNYRVYFFGFFKGKKKNFYSLLVNFIYFLSQDIVGPVTAAETTTTTLDDPVQLDYDEDPLPKRIVISRVCFSNKQRFGFSSIKFHRVFPL